jgi:phosphopentomutase
VLDGVGVGEMPDAGEYGDEGSNTLGNLSQAVGGLKLPCLQSTGLGNIGDFHGIEKVNDPLASYGKMEEISKGKDTITGHWEMMGIINESPFPTYPRGFPPEIIEEFRKNINRNILCNRPASGTEIIKELGEEHIRTGSPIVYTSADSVFQIAAHEDVIPVEELYEICKAARKILVTPHNVCKEYPRHPA